MSTSKFDQGDVEQPISVMMQGIKWLENDRCTFGGSDRTPGLGVLEGVTVVVEDNVADEILTCIPE